MIYVNTRRIKNGHKGIYFKNDHKRSKPWIAEIMVNYKRIYLGSYLTENEAMVMYNKAAIEYFGEYTNLNNIKDINDNKIRWEIREEDSKDIIYYTKEEDKA